MFQPGQLPRWSKARRSKHSMGLETLTALTFAVRSGCIAVRTGAIGAIASNAPEFRKKLAAVRRFGQRDRTGGLKEREAAGVLDCLFGG